MFSNFLYFITALVIYTTSDLFETAHGFDNSILSDSLLINIFFVIACHIAFNRLKKKINANPYEYFEHLINNYFSGE